MTILQHWPYLVKMVHEGVGVKEYEKTVHMAYGRPLLRNLNVVMKSKFGVLRLWDHFDTSLF